MGAAVSLQPEVFTLAKEEYESKKESGLTDEQLFNHMKAFIEAKTKELETQASKANNETEEQGVKEGPQAATTIS